MEAREASLDKPESLVMETEQPADVAVVTGFIHMDEKGLSALLAEMGFAMDLDDLLFCQEYFKNTEKRDPTVTELRMIDTYWSDHCRHTTFSTKINNVHVPDGKYADIIRDAYAEYLAAKKELYASDRDTCLMNMATIIVKQLKKAGKLKEIDESEEINACSIVVDVDVDGKTEPWLIMFKNETHNHPTEIEPFGGAATCLGGAIRDPLSGDPMCIRLCALPQRRPAGDLCSNPCRQADAEKNHHRRGGGVFLLWKPNRPCYRAGCGNL